MKTINCETIRNELTESSDEIRRLREDIHSHPELGNNEFRTADLIESYLNSLDITTIKEKKLRFTDENCVGIRLALLQKGRLLSGLTWTLCL